MTDYASQGKTQDVNVVDIAHSKHHQAVYTALSRGKLADSTLILRDFPSKKVQGLMNSYLRAEYRAIETLDEITDLHYKGILPTGITQRLRESTITAFKAYRGDASSDTDSTIETGSKRKATGRIDLDRKRKRVRNQSANAPENLLLDETSNDRITHAWIWDAVDWSCACDSVLTILLSIWSEDCARWYDQLKRYGPTMQTVLLGFERLHDRASSPQDVRNDVREILWRKDPISFPRGPNGTDMLSLAQLMVGMQPEDGPVVSVCHCQHCSVDSRVGVYEAIGKYVILYEHESDCRSTEAYLCSKEVATSPCPACGSETALRSDYAPLLMLQLPAGPAVGEKTPIISPYVKLVNAAYRLRGIVYGSAAEYHFNARLFDKNGEVYRYDDMLLNGAVELEGMLTTTSSSSWLSTMGQKGAIIVVYTRED
jgi:hypothetical protein